MSDGLVDTGAFARLRAKARYDAAMRVYEGNGRRLAGMSEEAAMEVVDAVILARACGLNTTLPEGRGVAA